MKRITTKTLSCLALALLCGWLSGCRQEVSQLEALNKQATSEYEQPIRPGGVDGQPFWNINAKKFIYAPVLGFGSVEGAEAYRCEVLVGDSVVYKWESADTCVSLAGRWASLPVGKVDVAFTALDGTGESIGEPQRRTMWRDYPFSAPYPDAARPYREAAIKGALFVHNIGAIRHWLTHTEPDMSFENNTYACKIIGATVRLECLLAQLMPAVADDALAIARNAAECLMRISQPADAPLAYFPPTYYLEPEAKDGWPHHVYEINRGKTMYLEAAAAAEAFLDMYEASKEEKYKEHALNILGTYRRTQNADGSFPIKVDIATGKATDAACCTPAPLLCLVERVRTSYGVSDFDEMATKAEKWMMDNTMKSFNLTGQFEDQRMEDLKPYQNLTNCTANDFADYLLNKNELSDAELAAAIELVRFAEDQFVHWELAADENGFGRELTPCVHEQYFYETPVDASCAETAGSFMGIYRRTGDELALEKAKALLNAVTRAQNITNGQIPTTWEFNSGQWDYNRTFWPNCTYACVVRLLAMAELLGE